MAARITKERFEGGQLAITLEGPCGASEFGAVWVEILDKVRACRPIQVYVDASGVEHEPSFLAIDDMPVVMQDMGFDAHIRVAVMISPGSRLARSGLIQHFNARAATIGLPVRLHTEASEAVTWLGPLR